MAKKAFHSKMGGALTKLPKPKVMKSKVSISSLIKKTQKDRGY